MNVVMNSGDGRRLLLLLVRKRRMPHHRACGRITATTKTTTTTTCRGGRTAMEAMEACSIRQYSSVAAAAVDSPNIEDEGESPPPTTRLPQPPSDERRIRPRLQALRNKLTLETPKVSKVVFSKKPNSTKPIITAAPLPEHDTATDLQTLRLALAELPDPAANVLTDTHARHHNYLRISVAERCNLRCTYCMPEQGVPLQPAEQLLQTPELLRLASTFSSAGVTKFRLTGGEPTLRPDLVDIVAGINRLCQPDSIGMTTNGIVLHGRLDALRAAGLTSVNISLDTVDPAKFAALTRRPAAYLSRVWQGLERAVEIASASSCDADNFTVKLNCVVMRGTNDAEVADFVRLTDAYKGLQVRFIEYMPFSDNGWNWEKCVPYKELLESLNAGSVDGDVQLTALPSDDPHDTTKWYTTANGGRVGFITSMSQHFCGSCNRLRLTADGQIKVCLFDGAGTVSLRDAVRAGFSELELRKLIHAAVQKKHAVLGGHSDPADIMKDAANNRPMTLIGG